MPTPKPTAEQEVAAVERQKRISVRQLKAMLELISEDHFICPGYMGYFQVHNADGDVIGSLCPDGEILPEAGERFYLTDAPLPLPPIWETAADAGGIKVTIFGQSVGKLELIGPNAGKFFWDDRLRHVPVGDRLNTAAGRKS